MAGRGRYKVDRRDAGSFIQLPLAVLNSAAYLRLSASAKVLLIDVVSQYKGDNNGKLLTGWRIMSEDRGWTSRTTLFKAKTELLDSGLLFETRKGARPNKSSWCAATWWALDWTPDMDIKEQSFPRGQYRDRQPVKINPLSPETGQARAA
ncbi:hypothetical protein [Pusillimonas noertemannii]|uniref:Helix-turn-helix protein n=1 Tax=Pusillimonas noertemannii TaxID=305977 RepID=A0A2U1CR53_9BURK|nr:hypothetical protein [Pusillimonas noertemannii]NYT67704.1 hypothetical protein [Pusillimonas noertemannii]PVY68375.1 hypothetical protein C7440_0772 [Pusillimonas noertemannii]TFL12140.1 hypothetical protein CSC72_03190 [Pusillimonas noertemannii]